MKEIHYLKDMSQDEYYPTFLVDKIKVLLEGIVHYLAQEPHTLEAIQAKLDEITYGINDLVEEFEEHNSELETVARDSIAETVMDILQAYDIELDIEDALREREW
ncbi:DUF5713 family protein [Lysinibacillus piscis]|uniref:Uncharacterized protein n=1 Tax=Lysinibacillus piscis TaxID=2518931 RepID=A0ABQ5NGE5_9BACI|nr:DUF5713 family protein [Lysinibacillus sp. KH24]GLC87111.1 hypothetical protein LYSBPC_02380 [Lysinibacillus sp. KH24]